jgi:uncharacterized protein YkwD
VHGEPADSGYPTSKGPFLRQLLRRAAVTAVLAPVAALGATTMIASPAEAVPALSGSALPDPSQPGSTQPGSWKPGSWNPGTWKHGSWKNGSWRHLPGTRSPLWPVPAQPTRPAPVPSTPGPVPSTPAPITSTPAPVPSTPAPITSTPAPTTPAPAKPAPTTPAPVKPAPTTPAPVKPAPTTPAPIKPAPTTPAPVKPAPTTPAPGGSAEQVLEAEINRLINVQRSSNGCAALTVNDKLTTAARNHSAWMAQTGTLSHTGSGGSTFASRVKAAGYAQPSAENIAMGYRTAAEVVNGWMNSSGHRANILNCQSKAVGVGVVNASGGTPYYTQNFGY